MIKESIKKGSIVNTLTGYMIVTGYNGHIVYVDQYVVDECSNLPAGDMRYTLDEIGHLLKECDGRTHRVVWEEV